MTNPVPFLGWRKEGAIGNLRIRAIRKELDLGQLADVLLDLAQEQQRKGRRPRRTARLARAIKKAQGRTEVDDHH